MIDQIKYEWKKYIFRPSTFVIMILLSLLFVALLLQQEFSVFISKRAYENYFNHVGNTFDQETKEAIGREQEELHEILYKVSEDGSIVPDWEETSKKGKYGPTQIVDYMLMGEALDCIDVVEKRNRNMEILLGEEGVEEHSVLAGFYEPEQNHQLTNRERLNQLVKKVWFGWFSCLAVILILGHSFSIEGGKGILPVICATQKGEDCLYLSKILAGFTLSLAVSVYFFLLYLVEQWVLLGVNGRTFAEPLFLVDGYGMCASGMTIGRFLLGQEAASCLVTLLMAFVVMVCSKGIGRSIYAQIVSGVIFLAGTGIDLLNIAVYQNFLLQDYQKEYLFSTATLQKMIELEKRWNPFSLIQVSYYMEKPRFLLNGTWQYPVYVSTVIASFVTLGILFVWLVGSRRKK